jgi:hypothetical protein
MLRATLLAVAVLAFAACGDADSCGDCTISVARIASFGDSDGDGALEGRPLISGAFGGQRLVLQPDASGQVPRLFSSTGRFRSAVGTLGEGPGEFRSPSRVFIDGDTAWIIDGSLRRATAVAPDGTPGPSFSWQREPYDAVALDGDHRVLAGGSGPTRALAMVSRDGTLLHAFGDSMGRFGARWHLARAGARFWSAQSQHRLRFVEWAAPDSMLRVVEPVTPHFPPYAQMLPATPDRAPMPSLRGFWTDSLARIWALLEVPAADWRSGYGSPRVGEGGQTYMPMLDPNRAYASVLLVIDAASGAVVAERTLEGWFYWVVEPFVILRAQQDADGWYQGELWRVTARIP